MVHVARARALGTGMAERRAGVVARIGSVLLLSCVSGRNVCRDAYERA